MSKRKTIMYLCSTLILIFGWLIFSDRHSFILEAWNYFGVDLTKKYDLFLFSDSNEQRLKWYAYDTGYFLTIIILFHILRKQTFDRGLRKVLTVFYYFSIFRLFEYYTFRFHIGLVPIVLGILIFSIYSLRNG